MSFEVHGMSFEVHGMSFEVHGMSFEVHRMLFEVHGKVLYMNMNVCIGITLPPSGGVNSDKGQ
jgi:hypothetical protein